MNGTTNGNGELLNWVLASIIGPPSLTIFGFLAKTTIDNTSRLSALERDTEHRLWTIEHKLDRILEKNQ